MSCDDLIATYKDQQKVERGFRFLKYPMFMASQLFLKSPQRVMALLMVMTLCLVVYAALEFRIRAALRENVDGVREFVSNLTDFHVFLLDLLGVDYRRLYLDCG